MHNEIYDMDKKLCFSDCPNLMSVPSPCSSQSSMSSSTSGNSSNSTASNLPILNFAPYDMSSGDIHMAFSTVPVQNLNTSHFIQRSNANMVGDGATAYTSQLVILEQPTEKFRFRYKSEMHGTHGSLNGERSEKNKKTFPEVELRNFAGNGVIRCSLYQTNLDKPSPHSHQLVVRKDDMDECDPHDLYVSPEKGCYIARFENMGIIHTAKKNICDALYAKKKQKMKFETGCEELSQRQEKALRDEAEREGKLMNLNQVRLCFEAFQILEGGVWKRICEPVFSRPINNRKSALTGELKICRLSTVVGSAEGGEDLILLVEKVSKKNIQVRFFELREDDQVWEAFGDFSDADVHHQYAIVVRTPPYRNKDIDTNVTVFIELVRKSDDERSAPLNFRYKPRDIVLSRKRRRTSYPSSTSSPLSSSELPEPVAKGIPQHQQHHLLQQQPQTISQEFNKDAQLNSLFDQSPNVYQCQFSSFMQKVSIDSDELKNIATNPDLLEDICGMIAGDGFLQTDGEALTNVPQKQKLKSLDAAQMKQHHPAMKLFVSAVNDKKLTMDKIETKVRTIYDEYSANNENGDTIVHDIVKQGQQRDAIMLFKILSKLNLTDLLSQTNNHGQTPLHAACIFDQAMFIRPLLGLKCDPNVQDSDGNTALHIAINENLKECLESFVSYMASSGDKLNVNLVNDVGLTPLHMAIRQNNIDFVEILLTKCNASAKVASLRDGNNALHLAVQHHNKQIVQCLLEKSKVKVNAKNRSGHTAIDLAKSLTGDIKKDILDLLLAKLPSSNDDTDVLAIEHIKNEPDEDNDSSTEEDDDKSLSSETEERNGNKETQTKRILQNQQLLSRLGELLNVDNKWKKLGSELKLDHMLCLWINGESMLRYLVASDDVGALNILQALEAVDSVAASIVTSMMKT